VVAAPGSNSAVYRPNPGAIVVAIDPGHGGCLDWGVPNPYDNKPAKAEKADTLGIALALRALLRAQGITVVMTRDDDSAIAGDNYPALGCNGAAWRDVNGDGLKGFGPGLPEATRTRDELSARIDLANLARADLTISLHINSMTQNGVLYRIAASQTFYTNAYSWADASRRLGAAVQAGVVRTLGAGAGYKRQDRGVDGTAPYLYFLKPTGTDPKSPRRNLLMPAILAEVGSVSLEAEATRLATDAGRQAAATGVYDGIVAYLANRPLAARLDALLPGGEAGQPPAEMAGSGPPFWAPVLSGVQLRVRLTNTGTATWPSGFTLAAGWAASQMPYLATLPGKLERLQGSVPALDPGASLELEVTLPAAGMGRQVAWITLVDASGTPLTNLGVAPLQLATQQP
jgi:N-acetylmuramoyl-L-alanine amidase